MFYKICCLSKLRIKHQLFIMEILTLILTVLILTSVTLVNYNKVNQFTENVYNYLLENTISHLLDNQFSLFQHQMQLQNLKNQNLLKQYDQLFKFVSNQSIILSQNCTISPPTLSQLVQDYNRFPYFFTVFQNQTDPFSIPDIPAITDIVQFSKALNLLLVCLPFSNFNSSKIYFTSSHYSQFFGIHPTPEFIQEFKPHNRSWYVNQVAYNQNHSLNSIYIGNPYVNLLGELRLAITKSIETNQGEFAGVMAIDNDIIELSIFDQFKYLNVIMVDLEGKIISQNFNQQIPQLANNQNQTYYIYQEEYFGFQYQDWEQFKVQSKNGTGLSNCKNQYSSFCRFNTQFQSNTFVSIMTQYDKFLLIILYKQDRFIETQDQVSIILSSLAFQLKVNLSLFISISIFIVLMSYMIIRLFIKPYKLLYNFLRQSIYGSSKYNSKLTKQITKYHLQKIGMQSFYEKVQNHKGKSNECQIIQQFVYPKRSEEILFRQYYNRTYQQLMNVNINNNQQFNNNNLEQEAFKYSNIINQIQNINQQYYSFFKE